jgi:hypothetical protein
MIEFNLKKTILTAFFGLCGTISIVAQFPSPTPKPTPAPTPDLETILKNADAQTLNYREEFKNLLSEETKTIETFDKKGGLKKRTVIESNFIVYQLTKVQNFVSEYRNVYKVDGKPVGDSEKRTTELFEKIAKSDSAAQELTRIQEESSRYDKTLGIFDLTIFQTPILADYSRPFFDFKLAEREMKDREVFVVEYRQTKRSPYILIDEQTTETAKFFLSFNLNLPDSIKKSDVLLRGKLWIDTETFQLRREERELTLRTENSTTPLLLMRTEFEYQPSDFKIYVPKKIVLTYYELKTKDKGRDISTALNTRATFDYAKFSKSDVEVKSNEVNAPKN